MEVLGFEISTLAVCLALLLAWLVRYIFFGFDFFEKQGIPTVESVKPLIGNLWNIWKLNHPEEEIRRVKKFGKIYGHFEGKNPIYFMTDPELIKAVTIKEADCFMDRRQFLPDQTYIRKMMSVLRGQEWKDVRSATSPVFSSGKIKRMSELMEECCDNLAKTAAKQAKENAGGALDMKKLYGSYTLDVIATCAFGTKIDQLEDPNNEFVVKSMEFFRPARFNSPFVMLPFMFQWLVKMGVEVFPQDSVRFFAQMVKSIIENRRREKQKRGDALDILIEEMDAEAKAIEENPGRKQIMTEEVVVAQCVIFFLAGFDTTGTLLTMASYYLALNPDCQEKLHEELVAQKQKHEGKISHETIADCTYLDQVINETLRLAPPAMRTERVCTTPCTIGGYKMNKGQVVAFPIYGIHHLEENYPDPEKFDPERFSRENKAHIKPMTFLPFGVGPRNCVGMRFALEEAKLALATMVTKFKLSKCEKTEVPLQLLHNPFLLQPLHVYVGLEPRK